ncbi:MAG: V-type ATP synthase subunit E family protein [Thermoplasmata archaeon]|nr:V-type ATP synthase subunit E family protein [Thermoplasmata archaeon]
MGLERVVEEVLAAGEEQQRKIISEAETEKRKIISAARADAESARKKREQEFAQKSAMMRQQATSSAELEAKKKALQEQNELLSQTKAEVLKALASIDNAQRKKILERLSQAASKKLQKGIMHCRKEDEGLVSPPSGFKKVADLSGAGGLLVESEDGAYRIDLTFEALLEDVWTKNVRKIYEIVFGGA